jgi:acyl dehydratase
MMEITEVAQICHEANRIVQALNGDPVDVSWIHVDPERQERAVNGVAHKLTHPAATSRDMHANWMRDMIADGYALGPELSHADKTHPNLVDYDDLPLAQQLKDSLFSGIVESLRDYVT